MHSDRFLSQEVLALEAEVGRFLSESGISSACVGVKIFGEENSPQLTPSNIVFMNAIGLEGASSLSPGYAPGGCLEATDDVLVLRLRPSRAGVVDGVRNPGEESAEVQVVSVSSKLSACLVRSDQTEAVDKDRFLRERCSTSSDRLLHSLSVSSKRLIPYFTMAKRICPRKVKERQSKHCVS